MASSVKDAGANTNYAQEYQKMVDDPRRQALIRKIDAIDAELPSDEEDEDEKRRIKRLNGPPRKIRAQGKVRNAGEAKNIMKQQKLLDDIDDSVELYVRGRCATRDYEVTEDWHGNRSVIQPRMEQYPIEAKIDERAKGYEIDWDCDQIRALIKKFVSVGPIIALEGRAPPSDQTFEWTLDDWRMALGEVLRPELSKFLARKGPRAGAGMRVYALAWDFFKTRELLGLSVVSSSPDDLKIAHGEKGGEGEGGKRSGGVGEGKGDGRKDDAIEKEDDMGNKSKEKEGDTRAEGATQENEEYGERISDLVGIEDPFAVDSYIAEAYRV